jgi:hypothetical protein
MRAAWLALALVVALSAHAADPAMGRLFFTPAERAALEDARKRNIRAEQLAEEAAKRPKAPAARDVTVSGVVMRSDGESFAWVNGKGVEGKTSDGLRVRHTAQPNKVVVYDPDKGRMVQLKVGQRADLVTGRVEESYERRRRAPAEPAMPGAPEEPSPSTAPEPRKGRPHSERATKTDAGEEVEVLPGEAPAH